MKKTVLLATVLAFAGLANSGLAQVTILFNEGFEGYTTGLDIAGQTVTGGSGTSTWIDLGTASQFRTSTEQAASGTKSVKIQRTEDIESNYRWADMNNGLDFPYSFAQRTVFAELDLFLPNIANNEAWFGLQAWGNQALNYLGQVGVFGDGTVIGYHDDGSNIGLYQLTDSLGNQIVLNKASWNNFRLKLEYASASSVAVTAFLNNMQLYIAAGVPMQASLSGSVLVSDFDIVTESYLSGTGASSAYAYADNFRVVAIPEPASMLALGIGALALLRRKSK